MKAILLVFLGGGFGSLLRYTLSVQLNYNNYNFPLGTFLVNIIGSLIIGFVLGLALKQGSISQNLLLLVATGFCGGFTTFSTFAFENFAFLKEGDYISFAIYTSLSFIVAIVAVASGVFLSKLF